MYHVLATSARRVHRLLARRGVTDDGQVDPFVEAMRSWPG
jgi:hypothetical protein